MAEWGSRRHRRRHARRGRVTAQLSLLEVDGPSSLDRVNSVLSARHYLGPTARGWAWEDDFGVLVVASPTSRRIPGDWLELTRWCLFGTKNGGSRQFARARRWIESRFPAATTLVSYSDPSVGHTGALYRACGWWWAPTWHRLRPPPTGNGSWVDGQRESVKDRWVYPLRPDERRASILKMQDDSILRRFPEAAYREPGGVPFRLLREATAEGLGD